MTIICNFIIIGTTHTATAIAAITAIASIGIVFKQSVVRHTAMPANYHDLPPCQPPLDVSVPSLYLTCPYTVPVMLYLSASAPLYTKDGLYESG